LLRRALLPGEGESSGCDHPRQTIEDLHVGPFKFTRLPTDRRCRLFREHSDHPPVGPHGDAQLADTIVLPVAWNISLGDLAGLETTRHDRPIGGGDHTTDPVAPEERLAGCRADLTENDERAVRVVATEKIAIVVEVHPGEEQKIGETQIGEKTP
jgi:hypothetical protein